jgi:hypothetical protein
MAAGRQAGNEVRKPNAMDQARRAAAQDPALARQYGPLCVACIRLLASAWRDNVSLLQQVTTYTKANQEARSSASSMAWGSSTSAKYSAGYR